MTRQLLVPLRGGDRVEDILPYVRDVAQPGMTVVFLVHFGINGFQELAAQLLIMNSQRQMKFYGAAPYHRLSNVEQRIHGAAEKLRRRGVAVKVKFYRGSLRRLIRHYAENEPANWVIMRPARSQVMRWCHAIAAALGIAGRPVPAPVFLLFNPRDIARKVGDRLGMEG